MEEQDQNRDEKVMEGENGYRTEEIAEIEQAAVELVREMKSAIDEGRHSTLISDEAGGRIPTLLLKKIINTVHPEHPLNVFFVSGGRALHQLGESSKEYQGLFAHLRKIRPTIGDAPPLLVTQYVYTGQTIKDFERLFRRVGISLFDVACLNKDFFLDPWRTPRILGRKYGMNRSYFHTIRNDHSEVSGVRRSKDFTPVPLTLKHAVELEGWEPTLKEWNEIFEIDENDSPEIRRQKENDSDALDRWVEFVGRPITDEDRVKIQRKINDARHDVDLLARRAIEQVWGVTHIQPRAAA